MKTFTLKEEHEIYKLAYKLHLDDIKFSKIENTYLYGMCNNINEAIIKLHGKVYGEVKKDILNLPKFLALKPKSKSYYCYWWYTKNTNRTRIAKYKILINQTK